MAKGVFRRSEAGFLERIRSRSSAAHGFPSRPGRRRISRSLKLSVALGSFKRDALGLIILITNLILLAGLNDERSRLLDDGQGGKMRSLHGAGPFVVKKRHL